MNLCSDWAYSALENMVRNAVRYTAADTTVELSLQADRQQPGCLQLQVRDHGPGVPESMLPRLFEPFVRTDDARTRDSGGYGLGLAIARRIVEEHKGRIWFESQIGVGSTFREVRTFVFQAGDCQMRNELP